MKILLSIIIVAVAAIFLFRNFSKRSKINPDRAGKMPEGFYSINEGNQKSLNYFVKLNNDWFGELDKKYNWENFDCYDNRYYEYMYKLFDELPKQKPDGESDKEFFDKLTRGQKVFYSMLIFGGQVDNGGLYQFFFNKPEYSLAVQESLKELKLDNLRNDYEKCLNELVGSAESLKNRKQEFNNRSLNWETRWKAFSEGYAELPSATLVEDYYYSDENKKLIFKAMVDYIDSHLDQFGKR